MFQHAKMTCAWCLNAARAVSLPMPLFAPVTMTSLFDRSISFNTSSGVDFEENPVGPTQPFIVPMGQKHLCGGGNVFIKCVFFSLLSCRFNSPLFCEKAKWKSVFLFLPHKKSIFDAQMHYFLSLISLILVLPCKNGMHLQMSGAYCFNTQTDMFITWWRQHT